MLESPLFLVQAVSLVLFVVLCLDLLRLRRKWRADDARRISNEVVDKLAPRTLDITLASPMHVVTGQDITISMEGAPRTWRTTATRTGTVIAVRMGHDFELLDLIYR